MTQSKNAWFGLIGATILAIAAILGCGSEPAKVTDADPDPEPAQNAAEPVEPVQATNSNSAPADNSLVRQKGGKTWIGDVPLDVWFDDPLAVASSGGEITQPNPRTEVAKIPSETPSNPEPMPVVPETVGGIDWKRVIPAELLDAEVTSIRNRFNADLQTVGSYNSSYLNFPPHFASLAVLSHVAQSHPGEIRWKENAGSIKHLAGQMAAEPLSRGPASQRPLKEKFDYVLEILNGSVPATLKAPPADQSISEVAKVPYLMKRLENASKLITVNGGTADSMKSNADALKQEAAVLGALTQVLLDGYEDYQDDEIFEGFVKNMVDASVNMREHIQNDQFNEFELDVSKMTQACTQCHSMYR